MLPQRRVNQLKEQAKKETQDNELTVEKMGLFANMAYTIDQSKVCAEKNSTIKIKK